MPITSDIAKLETTKAKAVKLEKAIASKLAKELAGLPAAYGFVSVEAFVKAVKDASGGKARTKKTGPKKKTAKRRRAVITEAIRAKVKKLVQAKRSGSQIAKAVGISLPSVQNIKKALGLVKSKAKKAAPRKAHKKRPARKAPVEKAPAVQTPAAPEAPKEQ